MKKQLKFLLVIAIQVMSISSIFAQQEKAPAVKPGLESDADRLRSNAFKFRFLSPVFGHFGLSFEHLVKKDQSYEFDMGYVGVNTRSNNLNETGLYLGFGYKFLSGPDFKNGYDRTYALQGWYVKPQLMFTTFSRRQSEFSANKKTIFSGALLVNGGKQWLFAGRMVLDVFLGLGYGFTSADNNFIGEQYYGYGLLAESNLAIATGLKLGIAF